MDSTPGSPGTVGTASSSNGPGSNTRATLGLTGLTINAMALIAPGAFLWLTFAQQSLYGAPMAGQSMWFGILFALALCFATAIAYAELAKLYPGAGSSYFFAEQAFLSKTKAFRFARLAKFTTGWASHLYYWVYPGCMVGVTAILVGYLASQLWPGSFSGNLNSPILMFLFCGVFALGVGYIAYRGVTGTTGVNMAINVIQITALLIFAVVAIGYRMNHPEGAKAIQLSSGFVTNYEIEQVPLTGSDGKPLAALDEAGNPRKDDTGAPVYQMTNRTIAAEDLASKDVPLPAGLEEGRPYPVLEKDAGKLVLKDGRAVAVPFTISYKAADNDTTFQAHPTAASVVAPHKFSYIIIQACIAILILVGFESVTSMGEEARNAKRDIPRAVLLSLAIQGVICYLIEYFAAGYFLNSGYNMPAAAASGAPLGDMMKLVGAWLFGSESAGWWFMFIEALTVFLALVGTTLSCLSTGARVTYAMGRDREAPSHFGLLHGKTLTPHRAIWTLAILSAVIGAVVCTFYLGGADTQPVEEGLRGGLWYRWLTPGPAAIKAMPNTLLIVTLVSNFGTFLLYMMTCAVAIVAFREHHSFNTVKHVVIPVFGLLANLVCMLFYLVGPFTVSGMSLKEPFIALGICGLWGAWGLVYFLRVSKKQGKAILLTDRPAAMASAA